MALRKSGLSQREACAVMRTRRRTPREQLSMKKTEDARAIARLTELAQNHPRYGCKRLYIVYEREAEAADEYMNFKRFSRLYRLGNLQIARRRRRSRAKYVRGSVAKKALQPNDVWTMDFVSDRLLHGRNFRALTLVDEFSRFSFAVDPNFSYPSISVVRLLEQIAREHGYPSFSSSR